MLSLSSVVRNWLVTASPDTYWVYGGQVDSPAKAQSSESFGFYTIVDLEKHSMNAQSNVKNEVTDKMDRTVMDFYTARVSIDVLSIDELTPLDAPLVASKAVAYLQNSSVQEYFYENGVGFERVTSLQNLSSIESGQVRRRYHFDAFFNIRIDTELEMDYIVSAPVDYDFTT